MVDRENGEYARYAGEDRECIYWNAGSGHRAHAGLAIQGDDWRIRQCSVIEREKGVSKEEEEREGG